MLELQNSMAKKINIGSGGSPVDGFINVDKDVHDLNEYPWPFEDETIDQVQAHNILEHLDDLSKAMREIHRVLKPGCFVDIIVPHYLSGTAWGNPEHKRAFTKETLLYFVKGHSGKEKYEFQLFSSGEAKLILSKLFLPMGVKTVLWK